MAVAVYICRVVATNLLCQFSEKMWAVLCAGALVAGPDASGAYGDNRTLPGQSGVSLDGNAVLSGLLAGLIARDVQPGQCNGGRVKG